MPARIAASVSRVLRYALPTTTNDAVHFHTDADGRPYVCDYARCESPSIDPERALSAR